MNWWCSSIHSYSIDDLFHYFSMIARMNAGFLLSWVRMSLNSHCFLCVISHDIFKYLCFRENLSILWVTNKPKSRSFVIEVISDAQIVCPCLLNSVFLLVHDYVLSRAEDIVVVFSFLVLNVIYVHNFLVVLLLLLIIDINNLPDIINIHSLLLNSSKRGVISLHPSVFYLSFLGFLGLESLDSLGTWYSLGNEVLFFSR